MHRPNFHLKINNWEVPESSKRLYLLSFIDYEQAIDSTDRRALAKVPSLYGIPDK